MSTLNTNLNALTITTRCPRGRGCWKAIARDSGTRACLYSAAAIFWRKIFYFLPFSICNSEQDDLTRLLLNSCRLHTFLREKSCCLFGRICQMNLNQQIVSKSLNSSFSFYFFLSPYFIQGCLWKLLLRKSGSYWRKSTRNWQWIESQFVLDGFRLWFIKLCAAFEQYHGMYFERGMSAADLFYFEENRLEWGPLKWDMESVTGFWNLIKRKYFGSYLFTRELRVSLSFLKSSPQSRLERWYQMNILQTFYAIDLNYEVRLLATAHHLCNLLLPISVSMTRK